jgi:hypothetical protein
MVTKTIGDVRKLGSNLHGNGKVNVNDGVMDAPDTACQCSPMSSHAIAHLRDIQDEEENHEDCAEEVTAKQRRLQMGVSDEWDSESGKESVGAVSVDEEVQYGQGEYQFTDDEPIPDSPTSKLLISEKELNLFIRENFLCKLCHFRINEVNLTSIKVGCASSIFWECSNPACNASDNIIPKKATRNVSETYQRWHPDVPACLGDYEINRQVVLACQMSGDGARMASTFGGLMSLSRRSIWLDNFTDVEQEIGKAQIALGKKIIKENLQEEISLSPMDLELNKAKVTLMLDGGWDQRASGRAFNSSSGRVVSVGPLTNKVCGLVYYSNR